MDNGGNDVIRVLVGWDNPGEAETIDLILNAGQIEALVTTSRDEFEMECRASSWDVVVLNLSFPVRDVSFTLFEHVAEWLPDVPVIGGWDHGDIAHLAKFISHGLHSYVMRDAQADFILLLPAMVDAAQAAMKAKRTMVLAQRMREELDSVRKLQESMTPKTLPQRQGYAIAARYEPAQIRVVGARPVVMAGGDYYDIFELDDESLVLLVGDATGHGLKACMSIMTMHTLIRMFRKQEYPDTSRFVTEVNSRLCRSDIVRDEGGFITLLYSVVDCATHRLHWCSAGAPRPIVQDLDTNELHQLGDDDVGGLPLAFEDEWQYEGLTFEIPENSRLLIYTDGLEEAFPEGDDGKQQFGIEGIMASLRNSADRPIGEALQQLFDDSHAFTAGVGRVDDTSVVLLERRA